MKGREEKNTKRRFAIEALRLFAEKGYESVSVAEIAEAVGCSAPALYKHYKNKQELLDAIIDNSEREFNEHMKIEHAPAEDGQEIAQIVLECSEEEEIAHMQEVVRGAIHTDTVQWFRKMCVVEQFNMPRLGAIYTYRYITFQMEQAEKTFKALIERGKIKNVDPRILARNYLSVPTLCIGMCDREPDREEECMEIIANHVREFNKSYRID